MHRYRNTILLAITLATLATIAPVAAQDLHPSRRPSPVGIARTTVANTYLKVVYGRPYQRERDNIFGTKESGALVPFGEPWRTGANEATEITVTRDVKIGEKTLPEGTYAFFTTPGPEAWTVHFNRELGLTGPAKRDAESGTYVPLDLAATDVVTLSVPSSTLPEDKLVDQLTFAFEPSETGADLVLRWIRTEVRVPFTVAKP